MGELETSAKSLSETAGSLRWSVDSGVIAGWNGNQGIGRIYANYADASARAFPRGGFWNYTSNAGVLALSLGNSGTGTNTGIGFRVAR